MAPQYKLTYFNGRGRAELARWLFKVAEVDFEDYRIKDWAEWMKVKPTTPFGQVPLLEVDGKVFTQSHAICRYLARTFHMAGEGSEDQARVDMILDCSDDMGLAANKAYLERDALKKEEMLQKYQEEQLPAFMKLFHKLLEQNHSGEAWFVGDKMTLADLAFVLYTTSWLEAIKVTPPWAEFPLLSALKDKVLALPQLQRWFSERPESHN